MLAIATAAIAAVRFFIGFVTSLTAARADARRGDAFGMP
jgi:hypothetical protein